MLIQSQMGEGHSVWEPQQAMHPQALSRTQYLRWKRQVQFGFMAALGGALGYNL
jgi:hypothetical protein